MAERTAKQAEEETVAGDPRPTKQQLDQYAKDQEEIAKNPNAVHAREAKDFMGGEGGEAPKPAE
jgi:hypothetical protein